MQVNIPELKAVIAELQEEQRHLQETASQIKITAGKIAFLPVEDANALSYKIISRITDEMEEQGMALEQVINYFQNICEAATVPKPKLTDKIRNDFER
ncbi:MAG: hypothetical protein E7496_10155 [Ruminococcus sp.]|nr:hypothetical protein [Ruminococcus sp.]